MNNNLFNDLSLISQNVTHKEVFQRKCSISKREGQARILNATSSFIIIIIYL